MVRWEEVILFHFNHHVGVVLRDKSGSNSVYEVYESQLDSL